MERPAEEEIPYALYLKFKEPADAIILSRVFEFIGLGFLGEDNIDGEFKIQHYYFKTDLSKKILLHVESENNAAERINISIYSGASVECIKELFGFFRDNFEEDQVMLIDQQIKNELFLKEQTPSTEADELTDDWITDIEKQAVLPFDFNEFYSNKNKLAARNTLLFTIL